MPGVGRGNNPDSHKKGKGGGFGPKPKSKGQVMAALGGVNTKLATQMGLKLPAPRPARTVPVHSAVADVAKSTYDMGATAANNHMKNVFEKSAKLKANYGGDFKRFYQDVTDHHMKMTRK
jgi:hypothetical protein